MMYANNNKKGGGCASSCDKYASSSFLLGSQRRASWLNPPTEGGASSPSTQKPGYDAGRQEDRVVHDKSNVLLIGPTGSGTV
jgi:hypothetical protein